jgi:hypothetical protein
MLMPINVLNTEKQEQILKNGQRLGKRLAKQGGAENKD